MATAKTLQPRIISSFLGNSNSIRSTQSLPHLFRFDLGRRHVSMQLSRTLSGLTNLLFNTRNVDEVIDGKRKRLKPGHVSPRRPVPAHITKPPYVESFNVPGISSGLEIHDEDGVEMMRASGRLAARVREYAGTLVKPGVTTDEIDEAVHNMIIENGAYPSPLGYGGFPKSVCTSVNECICHGIPDSRPLEDGDIINIDVTVYLNGYHGDTSATFFCGDVDEKAKKLVQVTKESLDKAISICGPGVEYKKIGKIIHEHADKYKYGVVRQFVGHGIGRVFHADPVVLHFRNNEAGRMVLNQTFTIEPMLTIGSRKPIMWDDNWTVVTEDASLSAQFEHTILITKDGAEILTDCFGVSIEDLRGTWKHLGSKREWKMLFRRAKHQSGVRERRATPAPEESKVGATSSTEVIHPLQAQLLVDDFHDAKRPMGATSRTRAGCRATSGATSSTRARFGEVKHVLQSDLWERPSAPAPRFILCRKLIPLYNNQQGGYQANQSPQTQGSSSQAQAPDSSVDSMFKQLLELQARNEKTMIYEFKNIHAKIDGNYSDLNNKYMQLASYLKALENQVASMPSSSKQPMGSLPGKLEKNLMESCNVVFSTTSPKIELSDHEKEEDEIERLSLSGFGVSIGDLRGTWKHLGSKREWEMLFRRAKHQSGVRERRATPAPEESKVGATSSTEVIHPLQAQLLVDDFHDAKRPMGATSRTRAGCRATSRATSSTRARFGEVKHVLQSDLWERPSAPAPRFILCRKLMFYLGF
ncbi:hypothetical protein IGI04_000170 [Brassica rapa subsp. trilocularis]|uniref:Methionine aminopeptidase n=1 Tax=Brassica rapa subsp. trilocularis TaxID=1813537 RepID=A0ABQ7NPA4_BRACM|nr:hypothetical protein IGI04_000170 [Brassica rapa subsp. trilocularis]